MTTYTTQYPPLTYDNTYVKATSEYSPNYAAWRAADGTKVLTGATVYNAWLGDAPSSQKFIIDLGEPKLIRRLRLDNHHDSGNPTTIGIKDCIFYGTNSATAFANLTYADVTDLTELAAFEVQLHVASDVADPQYFLLPNNVEYRYYVLRIANNWGHASFVGFRRIELQTEDEYTPPVLGLIRAYTDMPYGILTEEIRSAIDIIYALTLSIVTGCELPYGIRLGSDLVMYYGDCLDRLALIIMHYGDCPVLRRGLAMPYDDLLGHRREVAMTYSMPAALTAAMELRYGIADTELRGFVDLQYELLDRELLRRLVDMPYLIQGEGMIRQVGATATIGGRPVSINHLSIEPDLEMYVIPAELHLTREADYLQVAEGEPVVIVVDGIAYTMVVDDVRVSRSERGTITWIVEALSPAIRLSSTWSRPLLKSWEPTTCFAVVTELVGNLGPVDFRIDDFPVVGLYANDEDVIEVIRKVLDTVDARLQSNPDGSLYVIYEEPVDWETRAPDYYISSERNFLSQDNTTIKRPGYNAFLIGNQLSADDRLWIEQRQVSGSIWEILGFQTPWDESKALELAHSGGVWVPVPEYMGVVEALYPPLTEDPERVEFVKGYAQTSRPIYDDPQLVWLQTQLGAILFAEDGRLEAEVKDGPTEGYGLADVRYLTRYHLWRVRNDREESVQYLLREVE